MRRHSLVLAVVIVFGGLLVASLALADGGKKNLKAGDLNSYEEVPDLSTTGTGTFAADIDTSGTSLSYELSYSGLESPVLQAHVHFGKAGVNGGISFFLCSNLGNGPAGTQTCPSPSGTVTGTITAAAVVGPAAQGIPPGAFGEIVAAMRAGQAYANVHTQSFPGGEIRAQINDGDEGNN